MADEPETMHPYITLLVARMRSHPDAVIFPTMAAHVRAMLTPAEEAALAEAEREIMLGSMHNTLMAKILAGDDAEVLARNDYERQTATADAIAKGYINASRTQDQRTHDLMIEQQLRNAALLAQQNALQRRHTTVTPHPTAAANPSSIIAKLFGK